MDGTAAYTRPYCSLYPDVLQLIPGGTAAYIVTCDFNEKQKSDFNFAIGFVKSYAAFSIQSEGICKNLKLTSKYKTKL